MKSSTIIAITVSVLLIVLSAIAGWLGRGEYDKRIRTASADTIYIEKWQHDTIILTDSKPAGSVIIKVPVYERDTIRLTRDTIYMAQEQKDSVAIEIPIEQRTYEGENYRAVVQGWRPELVAIDIRQQTIIVPEIKKKHWAVTIGPQVGYGFTPAGWQPYAGLGVTAGFCF